MNKVIYSFGNGIRYLEIDEPFNTKYPTWIIAYCPDINSFFVTNERHFFWESEEEFDSEEAGINYFENHIQRFLTVANLRDYTERVWLENTQKWYI
jgi:hypothetical protein